MLAGVERRLRYTAFDRSGPSATFLVQAFKERAQVDAKRLLPPQQLRIEAPFSAQAIEYFAERVALRLIRIPSIAARDCYRRQRLFAFEGGSVHCFAARPDANTIHACDR